MKKIHIVYLKYFLLFVILIFLLLFSIYTFKEGIKNKRLKKRKKTVIKVIPLIEPVPVQPIQVQPTLIQPTLIQSDTIVTEYNTIEDGNYIIMSDEFKSALSAYPTPMQCNNEINSEYSVISMNNTHAVTDIWTVKTVNNQTTIQQNNCNYLQLNTIDSKLKINNIIDPTTQTLKASDNSANIFYWKINKNPEDNTYSLVPFNNQDTTLYNFTFIYMNIEMNIFITNNNNNNKIAKFIFNKIS